MVTEEQINKAIGAHGLWKQRLRSAIDAGKSEFSVATMRLDNVCDFGKWLYSLPPAIKATDEYKKVKDIHAKFHAEAANVLNFAVQGKKEDAEKSIALGGAFAVLSADLTKAMMLWKKTLK